MNIEDIIEELKKNGFVVKADDNYNAYYTHNTSVKIGIFGDDYPYLNDGGKILAEHSDNFDKWSKAFYMSDMPETLEQLQLILADIDYISDDANKMSGNQFGHLFREFL